MQGSTLFFVLATLFIGLVALLILRAKRPSSGGGASDRRNEELAILQRDFLTKMGHNTAAVERIIDGLHKKHPNEPLTLIYQRAIQDWLKDNNRN